MCDSAAECRVAIPHPPRAAVVKAENKIHGFEGLVILSAGSLRENAIPALPMDYLVLYKTPVLLFPQYNPP